MYLLDTNICIYVIRRRPTHVVDRLIAHDPREVAISSVTLAELEFGVEKSTAQIRNRAALELFLAPLQVLAFDAGAAKRYGAIRADLERKGRPIGGLDLMIAAHALAVEAILVTNNPREFTRVPRLRIENWA